MPFLIALLAGAASVLAFAPFDQFWLMPLSWGVLYLFLRQDSVGAGRGFLLGWAWGTGSMFAGLCWIVVALHRFGGMSSALAVFLVFLFCVALGLYSALASALFAHWRGRGWGGRALLMTACWMAVELVRGQLMPPCPWLAVGYTQTPPSPLAGWAPVLGSYGVGFVLLLVTTLAIEAWRVSAARRRALVLAVSLCAIGGALRLIEWTAPVGAPLRVALIQTNVSQDQKWRPELVMEWLQLNVELLRKYPAQLMVLPESSLPLLEEHLPAGYLAAVQAQARAAGGDAILGMFTRDAAGGVYNTSISYGVSPSQRYSKNHLVPFGEFRPWGFGWFYDLAKIPMADQTPGGAHQPVLNIAGQKVAMNICYEDVFGEELRDALPEATLMLNVSNLAWYGDSHAQPQHLQMSRMRALEFGRPQLRATNTGMTAIVNPDGSVAQVLDTFTQGALVAEVRGYQGRTPFIVLGDWPVKAAVLAILLWALWQRWRRPV